jgi:ATP-dependent DNA ligase
VVEVAFQTITHERRLRMPRFARLRIDKLPKDCTREQLKNVTGGRP